MKVENLKIGATYKNYKEMCRILEEDEKKANSKKSQLKDWAMYFAWRNDGHKFVIEDIFDKPKNREDGRANKVPYVEDIQKLILHILSNSEDEGIFITKTKLFRALNMINDNYPVCKNMVYKLEAYFETNKDNIQEWFDTTSSLLQRGVESALRKLRSQSLVIWSNEMTVCEIKVDIKEEGGKPVIERTTRTGKWGQKIDKFEVVTETRYIHRPATEFEKKRILKIEKEILRDLGLDNKAEVIRNKKIRVWNDTIKERILSELSLKYYYDCYKIIFNKDDISSEIELKNEYSIDGKDVEMLYSKLNEAVVEKIKINTNKRYESALNKFNNDIPLTNNEARRVKTDYIEDNEKLTDTLVSESGENIIEELKSDDFEESKHFRNI